MRIIFLSLLSIATLQCASCHKSKTTTPSLSNLYIPLDMDSILHSKPLVPYAFGIPVSGVNGVLMSCRISAALTDTAGHAYEFNRNWQVALFTTSIGDSVTAAGSVSLNGSVLSRWPFGVPDPAFLYHLYDTVGVWSATGINHWSISGSSSVPAFNADIDGAYPSFTGSIPSVITKSSDFSYTFDASNTFGADSAYVCIWSNGNVRQSKRVSAAGGTIFLPAGGLERFTNSYVSLPPYDYVSEGGGYMLVVLLRYTKYVVGGRQYLLVKQRVLLGVVSFI